MTAATATPQVMRDRLLQAIDGQSNICNMVVVLEVVSFLEKYPITKESLEETRLGKLINDVRKKTKNEDLAKRAKKLLRNWQKLIEPGKGEVFKEHTALSWSSNGAAHHSISAPAVTTPSGKTGPELKNRNDFNNCYSPRVEKQGNRKRKGDQKEGQPLLAKKSNTTLNDKIQHSKQLPTNGSGSSSEIFTDHAHRPLDREISECWDNDRVIKIPISAVKPHPSAIGYNKTLSTSSLLKASVLQQQARQEHSASGGQYLPRSPRCSLRSPPTPKQEVAVKQTIAQAQSGAGLSSTTVRSGSVDTFGLGPSSQPLNICVQGFHTDTSWSADLDSQSRVPSSSLLKSTVSSFSDNVSLEDDSAFSNTGRRKSQNCRPEDRVVNLDRQTVDDGTKPVRLKDRRLTFDPVTGQIKPSVQKEYCQEKEVGPEYRPDPQWSEWQMQNPPVPPSPFQQTDWKELSRSEIIQSYLSQQSNVLTSSGAHAPSSHFFLKKEEHSSVHSNKTHMLAPERPANDLPGVSRQITDEDLSRLHAQHWSGVNGCYDTKGNWYDWTECISLDLHGDENRLNILPYICLD